jgi:predicted DNA-binding transcriptional regulator AlpA
MPTLDAAAEMRDELRPALLAAKSLPVEELPRLLGQLREVEATALARLSAPAPQQAKLDALLDINEASARLGVSSSYLYRHARNFSFARRVGRALRFSSNGIESYIRSRRGI